MLNFDGHSDGDGDGVGMCKQTFTRNVCVPVCVNVSVNFNTVSMADAGNGFQTHSLRVCLGHH